MQGQIGGVNGFVVIIFTHYILSDKAVWNEKLKPESTPQDEGAGLWKR
ncbi:hypothetical protein PS662_01764 [Pseudomonas fluorescens]|uniref:Uncharacterized protein n=1 Tax=Pseudomonas fluorescens TaxID=294 RepID=A0A5E6RQE4_PSEFL|nr:hypothetical protein PS662_01764 [Pseudomonas fluorescens]